MIPREILKKIRQIELRGVRNASRGYCPNLLKSPPEGIRIAAGVINGKHAYFIAFNRKINSVPKARHACPAYHGSFPEEKFRILANAFEESLNFGFKFTTQAGLLFFVIGARARQTPFPLRWRATRPPFHFHPKRLRASSRTCSQGIPTSSGVVKVFFGTPVKLRRFVPRVHDFIPNRSRSCSKTSRCSSSGSLSICSKTWAALILGIYTFQFAVQAAVFPSRITPYASVQP